MWFLSPSITVVFEGLLMRFLSPVIMMDFQGLLMRFNRVGFSRTAQDV